METSKNNEITWPDYWKYYPTLSRRPQYGLSQLTPAERRGLKSLIGRRTSARLKSIEELAFVILFYGRSPSVKVKDAAQRLLDRASRRKLINLISALPQVPDQFQRAWDRAVLVRVKDGKVDPRIGFAYSRIEELIKPLRAIRPGDMKIVVDDLKSKTMFSIRRKKGTKGKPFEREVIGAVRNLFCQWNDSQDRLCESKLIQQILGMFSISRPQSNLLRTLRSLPILPLIPLTLGQQPRNRPAVHP